MLRKTRSSGGRPSTRAAIFDRMMIAVGTFSQLFQSLFGRHYFAFVLRQEKMGQLVLAPGVTQTASYLYVPIVVTEVGDVPTAPPPAKVRVPSELIVNCCNSPMFLFVT